MTKPVTSDTYSTTEYDKEVYRLVSLGRLDNIVCFYMGVAKLMFIDNFDILSNAAYVELCGYLLDNYAAASLGCSDLVREEHLVEHNFFRSMSDVALPRRAVLMSCVDYVELLEESFEIDFVVETWEINASTN